MDLGYIEVIWWGTKNQQVKRQKCYHRAICNLLDGNQKSKYLGCTDVVQCKLKNDNYFCNLTTRLTNATL